MLLPAAYRSLSRPSSAPDAKAFALCSCSLEQSFKLFSLFSLFLELLELSFRKLLISMFIFPLSRQNCNSITHLITERPSNLLKNLLNYLFVCFLIRFSMTISLTTLQSSYLGLTILAKASKLSHFRLIVWWAQVDSNHRPRAYQARALTT